MMRFNTKDFIIFVQPPCELKFMTNVVYDDLTPIVDIKIFRFCREKNLIVTILFAPKQKKTPFQLPALSIR